MKKKTKEEKIDPKDQKIKELTETLQRLQAEFENYKKAVDKHNSHIIKCASEALIIKLLPILDSFELALRNKECNKEEFLKGVELIYSQLYNVLQSEGLKPIEALGKECDPYKHEVLLKEEGQENIVLEELQKGYMLNDKVIRHTKVKIGKQKKKKEGVKDAKK